MKLHPHSTRYSKTEKINSTQTLLETRVSDKPLMQSEIHSKLSQFILFHTNLIPPTIVERINKAHEIVNHPKPRIYGFE